MVVKKNRPSEVRGQAPMEPQGRLLSLEPISHGHWTKAVTDAAVAKPTAVRQNNRGTQTCTQVNSQSP